MTPRSVSSTSALPFRDDAASSKQTSSDVSFEQQLSTALSSSLQKLGKTPGEIRINVRNGDTPATRQFVITCGTDEAASTTAAVSPFSPSGNGREGAVSTAPNPFDGSNNPDSPATRDRAAEPTSTPWSPWDGPRDLRDALPAGGGQRTASGAPLITPNATPTRNQYNYTGPASPNPYFTNPGNPLRQGYVLGFAGWFQSASIVGPGGSSVAASELYYACDDGANEALRLVRDYEPNAQLTSKTWGGGPFAATRPMWVITLPDGRELNAGNVLNAYYNHGCGACISSDIELERAVRTT